MPTRALILAALAGFATLVTTAAVHRPASSADQATVLADAETKPDLKKFLYSSKGSYGWQPVKGSIMYDFFKDGRLSVQGPDGEATMWEGKWSLNGDQLTISYNKKTSTVTATIDGADLLLDGQRYHRYKPE